MAKYDPRYLRHLASGASKWSIRAENGEVVMRLTFENRMLVSYMDIAEAEAFGTSLIKAIIEAKAAKPKKVEYDA